MTDLTSRQIKARIVALASQIKHLRNKASSTEFPAERDTLIRVAHQQAVKMAALQTELARIPVDVRAPRRDPLAVLSDIQCHALILAERGFPRAYKSQIGKRTWSSLVRKKYIAFPKGSDKIVATEKGKAFLMALRKEYRTDMHTLVVDGNPFGFFLTPHNWAPLRVLMCEKKRIDRHQSYLSIHILRVPS